MLKEIKITVKEMKTKDGKTFNSYRAIQKDGRLIDCRFRKEVNPLPQCTCIIVVDSADCNISRAKEYPCLWIKAIQEIKPIETVNVELSAQEIEGLF